MHHDALTAFASSLLEVRRSRRIHFPAEMLLGDQIWDLLLVLFIADSHSKRLTGRAALASAGGSSEAGRRWIMYLTRLKHVVGDGEGNLDDSLSMTPLGLTTLERWLSEAHASLDGCFATRLAGDAAS